MKGFPLGRGKSRSSPTKTSQSRAGKEQSKLTDDVVSIIEFRVKCESNKRLLTEREGRTGEYWPEVVAVRAERRPIFPSTARTSSVSKLFIIWHSVSDSKMHFRWLALKVHLTPKMFLVVNK